MEFPQDIWEKIKSFIPKDKDMKSPTSDCIKHLVLYDIHLRQFQACPRMTFAQHAFFALQRIKMAKQRQREEEQEDRRQWRRAGRIARRIIESRLV